MTLNELRQEKEYGYKNPTTKKSQTIDLQRIINMLKKYPNDAELGREVRKYITQLGIYGK
jgi:hypothetical protein